MKYSCVTAERNVMYLSVTRENCSTSPVSRSAFGRIDLMKPPNSAPMTSRGTLALLRVSMAMPSRPMRLTASVPSTRSRIPESTSLNSATLSPRYLRQPPFESPDLHLRSERRLRLRFRFRLCRDRRRAERIELGAHRGVVRIARQEVFVDVARFVDQPLLRVEVGHG